MKLILPWSEIKKLLTGAAIAGAGAGLTYLTEYVSGADLGNYKLIVASLLAVLANYVRKAATANKESA